MAATLDRRLAAIQQAWTWLALALPLACAITAAHAQPAAWRPERTVEIVIPSAAGSSLDAAPSGTGLIGGR